MNAGSRQAAAVPLVVGQLQLERRVPRGVRGVCPDHARLQGRARRVHRYGRLPPPLTCSVANVAI
jgi:hypothetical protein